MNLLYNFNSGDANRPSFIEMFLESQMVPSLKPVIEWVLSVLAQRNPRLYPFVDYLDEIFYGVVFILERHYLKHYEGSFSENFYGLKRAIVTKDGKKGPRLQRRHKLWCLFFLVVVPYLKTKLDKYYQNNFENTRNRNLEEESRSKISRAFGVIYPYLVAAYEGLFFLYQILYMYDYTQYYTPFLHLQGLTIKRHSMSDLLLQNRKEAQKQKERRKQQYGLLFLIWQFLGDSANKFLDYFQYILPTAIFFFKFLEWWSHEPRFQQTNEVSPPPPEPPKRALGGLPIPSDKTLCAICMKPRTNPAMATSGFVYCYPCLFKKVEEHKRCPITFIPMETDQIRKLYDIS